MALEAANPLSSDEDHSELEDMKRRGVIAGILTLPVFVVAMSEHTPGLDGIVSAELSGWLQSFCHHPSFFGRMAVLQTRMAVNLPVAPEYVHPYRHWNWGRIPFQSIRFSHARRFSEALRGEDGAIGLYFEAAAVIVTLILLGQVMELRAGTEQAKRSACCLIFHQGRLAE